MIGGREIPEELDDLARAHEDDDFMMPTTKTNDLPRYNDLLAMI